jgi:FHS family L-fucose permease-like MFS transporter
VIASGITILQVVANPLAAALGPPERSHFRLTFSQTFNSLGTFLAPYLVAGILLSGGIFDLPKGTTTFTPEQRVESFAKIDQAFLLIAGALVLLAIFIFVLRRLLDMAKPVDEGQRPSVMTALKSRWGLFGAIAIFLYVGAEVSIGSAMTNFLHEPDMLGGSLEDAGKLVSFYWGGAMIGRLIGSGLLFFVKRASRLLAIFALGACALCLMVTQLHGETAAYLALSIGLFNSIMFPVIFTLQLHHVPGYLHAHAGTNERGAGGNVRIAVSRHRRRRDPAVHLRPDRGFGGPAHGVLPAGAGVRVDHRVRRGFSQGEDLRTRQRSGGRRALNR